MRTKNYNRLEQWTRTVVIFIGISLLMLFTNVLSAGDIYEAENATLNGAVIATNATGFSGSGFVDYINASNDYVEWNINTANAGSYELKFQYALSSGNRPLAITVNGVQIQDLDFIATGDFSIWNFTNSLTVELPAGTNQIRATAISSSGANIDYLEVTAVNNSSALILEAENAVDIYGANIASNQLGFSGTGFVDYVDYSGAYVEWEVNLQTGGDYSIQFGYALSSGDRPLQISVNGTDVDSPLSFPETGSFSSWSETTSLTVTLNAGINTIRATSVGSSGANVDYLKLIPVTNTIVIEAEDFTAINGVDISSYQTGFSGTGYADYDDYTGAYVEWEVSMQTGGDYSIMFGYALSSGDRPLQISVNGTDVDSPLSFPETGSFTSWSETTPLTVTLNAGINTIRATSVGSSGANVDYLKILGGEVSTQPEQIDSIGYWAFNEGSGSTAVDSSASNLDAAIFECSWITGQFGNALSFDGVNDYVDCGDPTSGIYNFGSSNDFSLSAWIRLSSKPSTEFEIISKYDGGWTAGFILQVLNSGHLNAVIRAPSPVSVEGATDVTDGNWHLVTATYDRDGLLKLYIDGNEDASGVSIADVGDISNSEPLLIGRRGAGDYFNGDIDEVYIFDRVLTTSEIQTLMGGTTPPPPPPPVVTTAIPMIIDTDMMTDSDDTGALAVAHALVKKGEIELIGVIVSTHDFYEKHCNVVSAINTYYGQPNIPIGLVEAAINPASDWDIVRTGNCTFSEQIYANFPHDGINDRDRPDSTIVYRQLLHDAVDNSVVIVVIGNLNAVANLLKSSGDSIDSRNGVELVADKVKKFILVGGGDIWSTSTLRDDKKCTNTIGSTGVDSVDIATQYWIEYWPADDAEIVIVADPLGNGVITGQIYGTSNTDTPMEMAYQLVDYTGDVRPSWDQLGIIAGARGGSFDGVKYWDLQTEGYLSINMTGEALAYWYNSPNKNHSCYLYDNRIADADMAVILNDLMDPRWANE